MRFKILLILYECNDLINCICDLERRFIVNMYEDVYISLITKVISMIVINFDGYIYKRYYGVSDSFQVYLATWTWIFN